jgi:hypothetical protein
MMAEQPDKVEDKPKRKAVNGRSKGAGFESTIAKLLSETFKPIQFRRSQSSGAILGGKNAWLMTKFSNDAKALFIGDIVPSNESDVIRDEGWRFRFTLECKFYKEADSFTALFKNPQIKDWFEQAYTDSQKMRDKEALLIFKFNHTPIFAAFETRIEPPSTITSYITLAYTLPDQTTRHLYIVPMADLLQAPDWWKVKVEA